MRHALAAAILAVGCVPNGPASTSDAGSSSLAPRPRTSVALPTPPAPPAAARPSAARAPSPPLVGTFEDDFERAALGSDWFATSSEWRIEGGRLCGKNAHNHGVWLARTLPVNARIEF